MIDQTPMTSEPMPEATALVLCGMFTRWNMGLDRPSSEAISWAKQAELKTHRASVAFFCRGFMESDADAATFAAEA